MKVNFSVGSRMGNQPSMSVRCSVFTAVDGRPAVSLKVVGWKWLLLKPSAEKMLLNVCVPVLDRPKPMILTMQRGLPWPSLASHSSLESTGSKAAPQE